MPLPPPRRRSSFRRPEPTAIDLRDANHLAVSAPPFLAGRTLDATSGSPAETSVLTLAPAAPPAERQADHAAQSSPGPTSTVPGTLNATDVSAWFSGRKVLERCSLDMPASNVTALIGPSGCGKSTFLRILNRMHEVVPRAQMSGVVALDGVDIYGSTMNATEVRLRIGMVFQKPNPFPAMSIRENVLAGLKLARLKHHDDDELVEISLRRAGLWNEVKDRLDQGGGALSGGQQQRLCIARALAVKPRVLLMDEPCSALDPISTRVIEDTIHELAHEITIVIVTHNMQQAARVSDICAFFLVEEQGKPGALVEASSTEAMFSNPRDPRTADYISGRFG